MNIVDYITLCLSTPAVVMDIINPAYGLTEFSASMSRVTMSLTEINVIVLEKCLFVFICSFNLLKKWMHVRCINVI